MPHGTPDYWPTTNLSIFSEAYTDKITAWREYEEIRLDIGVEDTIIDYTVPAGTILIIGAGFFTCDRPGLNTLKLLKDAGRLGLIYFDCYDILPPVPWGLYRLIAGEQLTVDITNHTRLDGVYFSATLTGFTEDIS